MEFKVVWFCGGAIIKEDNVDRAVDLKIKNPVGMLKKNAKEKE